MKNERKMVKVRCWTLNAVPHADRLLITYPEGHLGYNLIICLKCGQVHAANVSAQMYIKLLEEQLQQSSCAKCGAILGKASARYPETFIDTDGHIAHYTRSRTIPDDKESIVVELPSIY